MKWTLIYRGKVSFGVRHKEKTRRFIDFFGGVVHDPRDRGLRFIIRNETAPFCRLEIDRRESRVRRNLFASGTG